MRLSALWGKKMKVGVGYHNKGDAFQSGKRIAENALKNGDIQRPGLVFAFCHRGLDHFRFFEGLQTVLGHEVPIIGGSAIGVITAREPKRFQQ